MSGVGTAPFLTTLAPGQVSFWTGAGISRDAPTAGPLGRELTDRALDGYFTPGLRLELQRLLADLQVPNAGFRPRLETVLDALTEVYGAAGLFDVLSDLVSAPPNDNHVFFAQHMSVGGRHATANFDTCIETAGATIASTSVATNVVHFHGSLSPGGGVDTLGARLGVIENGFPTATVAQLDEVVGHPDVRALVFAGYSGSDFFDATPYLRDRLPRLVGRRLVVWHSYSSSPAPTLTGPAPDEPPYLEWARAAGARTYWVRGPLASLRKDLARAWHFSSAHASSGAHHTPWTQMISPAAEQRVLATIALYARMGVRHRVIELARRLSTPLTPTVQDRLADAYWGAGRYREALTAWQRAFADLSDVSRAHLAEREGAVLWIRGQLVQAERRLRLAVSQWAYPGSAMPLNVQVLLLEAYGRVLGRVP